MNRKIDKNDLIKIIIFLSLLFLSVGFSSMATNLYVGGTTNIANASFNVIINSIISGNNIASSEISNNSKEITFVINNNLTEIGDVANLDFEIKNDSSMYDATVTLTCSAIGDGSDNYTISSNIAGEISTILVSNYTKNARVNIELNQIPASAITKSFSCIVSALPIERTSIGKGLFQPTHFAYGLPALDSPSTVPQEKNVFVGMDDLGRKGVCIKKNDNPVCFETNNVLYEREHANQIFDECHESTYDGIPSKYCYIDDVICNIVDDGSIKCDNNPTTYGSCRIDSNNNVSCF